MSRNFFFFSPIVTRCDHQFAKFIKNAIAQFFAELKLYTNHNQDPILLSYANERTLASLFVIGLIRNDASKPSITAIQEYGTFVEKGAKSARPDIFIRSGEMGIWIESKYEKDVLIRDNHWDIKSWLEWDMNKILKQVERYYFGEFESTKDTYKQHYIMTLAFKLLRTNAEEFKKIINKELLPLKDKEFSRAWYYSAGFMDNIDNESKSLGVEVFGTFKKMR